MRIPVIQIFKESFVHVWAHKLEWLRVGFAPIVVFFGGMSFMLILYLAAGIELNAIMKGEITGLDPSSATSLLLVGLGIFIFFTTFVTAMYTLYINGYRYSVLNEGGNRWWTLPLNMRLVKMILYTLLFSLFAVLCVLTTIGIVAGADYLFSNTILDVILGILIGLYGMYLLIRIGLLLLLIAIDKPNPLRTSWHLLKGNMLRFIGLMLTIGIVFSALTSIGKGVSIPLILFSDLNNSWVVGVVDILKVLFEVFLILINWAVFSKAFALVYQSLTEGTPSFFKAT